MSLRLSAEPSSVPTGRNWVMHVLRGEAPEDDGSRHVIELLTSELITNAVTHGPEAGTVEIRARRTETEVRVEVRDGSTVLPVAQKVDPEALGGRGVGFVDLLSSEWGVILDEDGGKTVWFEVRFDRPDPFA